MELHIIRKMDEPHDTHIGELCLHLRQAAKIPTREPYDEKLVD